MERIQRSEGVWADIIRQCKSSGLSDERWLKENGICPATYYRHLKKFRNVQVGKSVPVPVKPAVPESHEVIPLTIMEEKPVCVDEKIPWQQGSIQEESQSIYIMEQTGR